MLLLMMPFWYVCWCRQLFKFTVLLGPHTELLVDRYSERKEKEAEGRLLSQAEKEARSKKQGGSSSS